ncbi:hypothetical protein [Maritimibacter fusiformis]|uniref:Uncharacterized protein n=1 Tax=Maritimibacter fusiformis TaxID=2603819 RepID=A0A5D0RHM4_9RHOB|nr:hypothetical protein [Maritimibacter fusiformis]TYB80933.1 hypothetical protein FVF75_10800 [Maritimibacter fusiformis]
MQIALMIGLGLLGFALTLFLTTRVSVQAGRVTAAVSALLLALGAIGFGGGRARGATTIEALAADWFAPVVVGMLVGFLLGKRRRAQ